MDFICYEKTLEQISTAHVAVLYRTKITMKGGSTQIIYKKR